MSARFLNVVLMLAGSVSSVAQATMTPTLDRGDKLVQHGVPGRAPEICVIPTHFADADYDKDDVKQETALCSMDRLSNTATCPKLNSTNPGVEFYVLPAGVTPAQAEAKNCFIPKPGDAKKNLLKKAAKYKNSTSCSYTPSIIGYYHLSRILGDVVNVPVAVLRTMDAERHKQLAAIAIRRTNASDLINKTWSGLNSILRAGAASQRRDLILTDGFDQSYGALQRNPKGEEFYKEMFNGGTNRGASFRDRNPIYKALSSSSAIAGREFTASNVQRLVQVKDVSEMIIMDHIMSQQDRFGNIHFVTKYYYIDRNETDDDGNPQVRSKKDLKPEEVKALGAVAVKEMILKDNDCGVTKTNVARDNGLIKGVRHIDPGTYRRLLAFERSLANPETKRAFRLGMMMTEADYTTISRNAREVVATLQAACRSGALRQDLDLEAHFAGKVIPAKQNCDL